MKPQIIFDRTISLLRKNPRFLFVCFVFLGALFYHYFIIPPEALKGDKTSKNRVQTEQPDLDAKHQEKTYPHIFQSQAGDVFRVGIFAGTKDAEDIEIFAESGLKEVLKIGEWHLEPRENGEYKELLFSTPGRYENIIIHLKKNEAEEAVLKQDWDDSAVYIHSFFISRVETKGDAELRNLTPTVFGISSMKRDVLFSRKDASKDADKQNGPSEWIFQAKGDYLRMLEFSGKTVGSGRQEYAFKLMRYFPDKKEEGELLHTASFILDALDDLLVSTGNYQIPFLSPLKQGEWYRITITKTPSKDQDNFFTIRPLEADLGADADSSTGDLALLIGEHFRGKDNVHLLDGARIEDIGKELSYSFSLQGTPVDFTNIFDASSSIAYDAKKNLVIGGQKNREYFIYKFDMPYPFDRFVLEATEEGNDVKEIKLEYSFDNAFWREIAFVQEVGDAQKFLLVLNGDDRLRTVYVRASYTGAEKKSGFFALKTLNINASMGKTR